jgi:hypothetical protein
LIATADELLAVQDGQAADLMPLDEQGGVAQAGVHVDRGDV